LDLLKEKLLKIKSSKLRFVVAIFPYILGNYQGKNINGKQLGILDFFTPFRLELNVNDRKIIVCKRNWFLIGVDRKFFNFGQIRNVLINEGLLLGDIEIRVYAGTIRCFWMQKKQLKKFESALNDIKNGKMDIGIVFDD
jgi:hypothetical protein